MSTRLVIVNAGSPTGLKFSVEFGDRRALFDFGVEHAPGRALFSLGLKPRPGRELRDLLAVSAAPRLEGVYDAWDGRTAVFISHLHLDHTGLVRFLHPDLPLHYPAGMEELRAAAAGAGYAEWRDPAGQPVADRSRVSWGEIEVEFVAVDHDLPGATGFVVRTPDLSLAYSGDQRRHGLHPELTEGFTAAARGVDVLIQEAVSLTLLEPALEPRVELSESEAVAGLERLVREVKGMLVVNLYAMNRERVHALGRACAAAGRPFLMEPAAAAVAAWPHTFEDPAAVPRDACLQLSFENLPTLIDLRPPPGSAYLHSDGQPLGVFDPRWPLLEAWAAHFGMAFVRVGSSGHSRPADLVRTVSEVNPGLVMPAHSRAPQLLRVPGVPSLVPEPLRPYSAEELKAAGVRRATPRS